VKVDELVKELRKPDEEREFLGLRLEGHAADWLEALAEVVKQLNAGSLAKMEEAHARLAELEKAHAPQRSQLAEHPNPHDTGQGDP